MNLNEIIAKVNKIDVELATVKKAVIELARTAPGTGGIEPAPMPGVPPVSNYDVDARRMLVLFRQIGGQRIDPVVGSDYKYGRYLELTKHTLSEPRPDLHEMFVGYVSRVSDQATEGKADEFVGTVGSLFLGSSWLFDRFGGYKEDGSNWHLAADRYFNMRAYMTPAERAEDDAAKAAWADLRKGQG